MAQYALMKKGEATMNVPPGKVRAYEEDGWVVITPPTAPESKPETKAGAQAEDLTVEKAAQTIGRRSKKG